jgi:Zn-dependent oligopeptidase
MNRDEILKIAAEAGAFWELSETPEKDVAFLMRVVERATEPLQARIKDLYCQLGEAEKQLDEQYAMGMKYKLDECILMLERLYERSGEQYKQYLHAAKVLKGEI